jgi:predicted DsbA family dithiol-disulfide isomerase
MFDIIAAQMIAASEAAKAERAHEKRMKETLSPEKYEAYIKEKRRVEEHKALIRSIDNAGEKIASEIRRKSFFGSLF